MTEYTTSSQALRHYLETRERTAHWIHGISGSAAGAELLSPSVPPSVLDGLVPEAAASEADSSHSTPPKMILRYGDGRPDVPIPHSRHHQQHRSRAGSAADAPGYRPRRFDNPDVPPEEIRILPSFDGSNVPASSSSRPGHSRSKSLPRTAESHRHHHHHDAPPLPAGGPQQIHIYPRAPTAGAPAYPSGQYPPRSGHAHAKHPPAIVYAPRDRAHYAPPQMFHHAPQTGPNGMMYSHSAPVPGQYPPAYPGGPYPGHRPTGSAHDVRADPGRRDRMRSLGGRATRRTPSASSESLHSGKSGSTYYVLPSQGQKVHVISPSPDQSIITAPSAGKMGGKKPFFQRLFSFKKVSHAGSSNSSSEGRGLHRSHSLGGGHHGSHGSSES